MYFINFKYLVPKILFQKLCFENLILKILEISLENLFQKISKTNNLKVTLRKDKMIILKLVGVQQKTVRGAGRRSREKTLKQVYSK